MDLPVLIISIGINILIGLAVYLRNRKSATHILFFLLTSDIAFWSIANYFSLYPAFLSQLDWMRLVMFFAIPQTVLFFLLIHTFPSQTIRLSNISVMAVIVSTLVAMFTTLSPYLFVDVVSTGASISPVVGPGMILFLLVAMFFLISGTILLVRKYRSSLGIQKAQLRFILFGLITMFFLMVMLNFVFVVVFKVSYFVPLSPLYSFPFVGAIAFAIARHRFLDVELIIARSVAYVILIAIVAFLFSLYMLFVGSIFLSIKLTNNQQAIFILFIVGIALSFQYLQQFVENITDRYLFRGRYKTADVIGEINHILASTIELQGMSRRILETICDVVHSNKGAVIIVNDHRTSDSIGFHIDSPLTLSEREISLLQESSGLVVIEDLNEQELKEFLRSHHLAIVMRLEAEGKLIGYLFLGEKASGDIYSEQDLDLFKIVSPEVAVGIQNAKAYEEIRRFNVTLQQEIKRATGELTEANSKLQELDKLKDEFVSLASHELRTPMTAIKGSISTILEGYAGDVSSQAKEFLTAAYNENDRLIRLVNNLLNISRIEAGRFTFMVMKMDMNVVINEVLRNLQIATKEKNIYLKYEPEQNLPPVLGDEDKVKEVLINFLGNALKHTYEGGITVRTHKKDDMVVMSVTDTGHGIAKEDQEQLFQKFVQIQRGYAQQTGGTGLGLYICKKIAEGLKGKVWLESEVGKGSTFFFSLPVAQ